MSNSKKTIQLTAETRKDNGTGSARASRREGKIPAIIYGSKQENTSILIDTKQLTTAYVAGGFLSKIVEIDLDGKNVVRVLPREVQVHPVTDVPLHVDFLRLVKGHEIIVGVRVIVKGADTCPGIKRGGNLNLVRHTVDFRCDPENIPDSITIDVSELEIGHSIHISHVDLPKGVEPVIKDRDFTIASIVGRVSESAAAQEADAAAKPAEASKTPAKAPSKTDKK